MQPSQIETPKKRALRALKTLSDTATYEDMMHKLYVLEKLERGLADIETGRIYSHHEAKKQVQQWLKSFRSTP